MKFITYNILSSGLAKPSWYKGYPSEHLNAANRLDILFKKLKVHVEFGKSYIALQEVSMEWDGPLQLFFEQHNYQYFSSVWSATMGVAIAVPKTIMVKSVTSETLSDGIVDNRWPFGVQVRRMCTEDSLDIAKRCRNRALAVRMIILGREMVFVTYHMPCKYQYPKVMWDHVILLNDFARRVSAGDPVVVAGDFNIKPTEDTYAAVFGYPGIVVVEGTPMRNIRLKSAYLEGTGGEPIFTNKTATFCDTLDYILYSGDLQIDKVMKINVNTKACPNEEEPSDHLMIGADISYRG